MHNSVGHRQLYRCYPWRRAQISLAADACACLCYQTKTPRRGYHLWLCLHPSSCLRVSILIQPWWHRHVLYWRDESTVCSWSPIRRRCTPSFMHKWSMVVSDNSFFSYCSRFDHLRRLNSHETNLFAKWGSHLWRVSAISLFSGSSQFLIRSGMRLTLYWHHIKSLHQAHSQDFILLWLQLLSVLHLKTSGLQNAFKLRLLTSFASETCSW